MTQQLTHPTAVITMENGAHIVLELFPEYAPNTVASFIYAASHGWMDHFAIQRIVPGNWVDVSYTAFGREECKYLIPNEFALNPQIAPLPSVPGCVCMGGYGDAGLAGCEFFFPLRPCPEHLGVYPVFGYVKEGMEEIRRIAQVPTVRVYPKGCDGVEINTPVTDEVISSVSLQLNGYEVVSPVLADPQRIPENWL